MFVVHFTFSLKSIADYEAISLDLRIGATSVIVESTQGKVMYTYH
jgi:hypothetical protein